jgi:S-adenosylmethionine:tRNA ribosyltransferase-isomerase
LKVRAEAEATPTDDFDYPLPARAIAQQPLGDRSASRMLVLGRGGRPEDRQVADLPSLLRPGDCLVVNDTRVRAARVRGRVAGRPGELLLLRELGQGRFSALVRPGRLLRPGAALEGPGWRGAVLGSWPGHPGGRVVALELEPGVELEGIGEVPLPPYLREGLADPERYQTVYSVGAGVSAAAPTAGLHLTQGLLDRVEGLGASICRVQLEIGIGTFAPIRTATIEGHQMHSERYRISPGAAAQLRATRADGGRVVAVGTTAVRCLESSPDGAGAVCSGAGDTGLYLRPGCGFQVVDGLLTNFHQPRSSLLVMVSAFFGTETVRTAYQQALAWGYRFLSFGDCMFGWRAI